LLTVALQPLQRRGLGQIEVIERFAEPAKKPEVLGEIEPAREAAESAEDRTESPRHAGATGVDVHCLLLANSRAVRTGSDPLR